ncbi:RNA polymerase sigma-70 factor [Chitinophaga sp. RAB17]|uniref:RNA polymerase sigma-70 factor n=1 Tax=Chitinophaga sp. RAB17 TaxID=3233049 RepID=UPI003F912E67
MFHKEITDIQLWNAVRANNQQAFNKLFDKYWVSVYKTGYKYLRDKEASQEIVHDIFLSIWNRRHELMIDSFPAFLLTSARYQIYSRKKLKRFTFDSTSELAADPYTSNDADIRIRQTELNNNLQLTLQDLPNRCQEIFRMSRFECLSNDEIAVRLDISKRTVENQLTMALRHIRSHMKDIAGH